MNIEEAKICLSIQIEVKHRLGKDYEAKALQLGMEALTRVEGNRRYPQPTVYPLLPSETKKEDAGEASPNGEPLSSPQQAEGYPAEGK